MERPHDEHYIRSITDMGDVHTVVTSQAIFTSKKIKLIEKGVKVNSALFDRLASHKLIPKIDHCLTVENGVTSDSLREQAEYLLDNDPGLTVLRGDPNIRSRMLRAFHEIPLLAPMAFKLTLASKQRPEVFDHSLRVALVALNLAIRNYFFSAKELATLAAAAVFHDIGILHISPELLRPGRRLKQAERHHLYAHPITGYLALREFPEYHPEISRTVFEHHERLDGSGYPRGLKEGEICLGAQILMLAETANTVFERNQKSQNLNKFSVLLRLNRKKFNSELSNCLLAMVRDIQTEQNQQDEQTSNLPSSSTVAARLENVTRVFRDWSATRLDYRERAGTEQDVAALLSIIDERIEDLQRMLLHAGFDVSDSGGLIEILEEDPEAMDELHILLGEVRWQLSEIIHEAHRRMEKMVVDALEDAGSLVLGWLARSEKVIEQI